MANTFTGAYSAESSLDISSGWRKKYFSSNLQQVLRKALVAEKICNVDRSGLRYISNPYGSQPSAAIQSLAGTYSVSAFTVTDDTLQVNDEVTYGEHVFGFEKVMSNFNLMAERMDEMAAAIATGIDKFVLNNLCEDATGTYETPSGGFNTASNVPVIISNIIAKVSGYADSYKGLFLVVENSDLTGIIQSQMASGFNYADAALNNGMIGHIGNVELYIVRDSTFVDATLGSKTVTNSGHRVAGVKNVATYCVPEIDYDEKGVTGKTGREISVTAEVGFKLWTQKAGLVIDITIV